MLFGGVVGVDLLRAFTEQLPKKILNLFVKQQDFRTLTHIFVQ
jgi:hypothetical protein